MDQSDGAGAVRNPYEVLGVSPDASPEEIRDAYWRLVRFHRTEGEAESGSERTPGPRAVTSGAR